MSPDIQEARTTNKSNSWEFPGWRNKGLVTFCFLFHASDNNFKLKYILHMMGLSLTKMATFLKIIY